MGREGRKEGGERDGKNKRRKQKGTQLNCHSKVGVADQERLDDGGQEGGGGLGPSGEEDAQGVVLPLGVVDGAHNGFHKVHPARSQGSAGSEDKGDKRETPESLPFRVLVDFQGLLRGQGRQDTPVVGPGTNAASVGVIRVVVVGNGDVNADAEVAQVDVEVHPGLGLVLVEPGEEGFPVSKGGSGTRVAGFREDSCLNTFLHRSDDEVVAANDRARSFLAGEWMILSCR